MPIAFSYLAAPADDDGVALRDTEIANPFYQLLDRYPYAMKPLDIKENVKGYDRLMANLGV